MGQCHVNGESMRRAARPACEVRQATPSGRTHPVCSHRMNMPSMPAAVPLLEVAGLAKRYGDVPVFTDVSLVMQRGELVALLGESGVGKSSLLNCVAGLDTADAGRITLAGRDVLGLSEPDAARLRREDLGF